MTLARTIATQVLIEASQQGDEDAANELLARYYPIARRLAVRELGSDPRKLGYLEDVVQDALTSAYRGLASFEHRSEGAFGRYLSQIIRNQVRDRARRDYVRREEVSPVEHTGSLTTPTTNARRQELLERFEGWMASLSPVDRRIFDMKVLDGRRFDEIAVALDWKSGSVRSRYARILAILSELWTS